MSAKRTFGQVSRLPSKRHRARYTGPDGALHSAQWTFETSGDAEAWLVDERRLISSGRVAPLRSVGEAPRRPPVAGSFHRGSRGPRTSRPSTTTDSSGT